MKWRWSSDESRFPEGRGWLYLDEDWHKVVGIEYVFGKGSWGASLHLNWGDYSGVMFYVGIPLLCSLYLTLENIVPKQWLPGHWEPGKEGRRWWYPEKREIGITVHDKTIWFKLWANPMEWFKGQPWWWEFNVAPLDVLLGRQKYARRDISEGAVNVWMPEGIYPATYKVFESTWKRPRWPKVKRVIRTDIDLKQPIPFSGKGENSWDCGEDGLWGITIVTNDPQHAARETAQSALETRRKRGDPRKWPVAPVLGTA